MTPATSPHVMPDLIRHPAFSGTALEGSETPDQVRGDDVCDERPRPTRHAELVSASISRSAMWVDGARWTLKQVQGDAVSRSER